MMADDAAAGPALLPGKIMLVNGPLSGQVISRPDTGNAYVNYLPPGQILPGPDLPARFKVASYLVLRCEYAGNVFWIGSTAVDPDPHDLASALSPPEAEQCREGSAQIAEKAARDD